MTTNDKLLQQFMQAGIDKLDIENLLSDSEVLAISWVGEIFSIDSENAWYNFVVKHFTYLFHHIPERSRLNRRRRNLWKVTDTLRQKILKNLPYGDILIIDSLPVPICDFKRAHFSKKPIEE